jgi:hypothetical protein
MAISRAALLELERKTLALRQPGNRICAYTDSSCLSGWVMVGLLVDDNFVAIAIPRADYRAGELCKILGFGDPFDPNAVYNPPQASAYSRAVQQRLQPPQATAPAVPLPLPAPRNNAAANATAAQRPIMPPHEIRSDMHESEPGWADEPSIPFEDPLTPLRGDEWDEPPALHLGQHSAALPVPLAARPHLPQA